jgi:voltage-dependent potassium channel beta subunit
MEYRRLGKSGLKLSVLSFGSWVTFVNQLASSEAERCMAYAYDHGVNFFDNAEAYASGESEVLMGKIIQELGWQRDTYIVSSKVFWGGNKPTQKGLSRKHVFDACHAALKRLRVDYLDLYFCHRPDPETPVEETVLAMNDLIRQGKILYWGTSEWGPLELSEAFRIARDYRLIGPTMEQPQYNLFHRENVEVNLAPMIEKEGLGTTIWSPLASGILSGKYTQGIPQDSRANLKGYEWLGERFNSEDGRQKIEKAKKLEQVAKALGASVAQTAIAWCASSPYVSSVILGASKLSQLEENMKTLEILPRMTAEVRKEISVLTA